MAICPKDGKPCIDDLCYGGSCLQMPGIAPQVPCEGCGALIGIDGDDDLGDCTCGMDDYYDDPPWEDDEAQS